MVIYAISGLGADKRVYQYLELKYDIVHLEWCPIKEGDGIVEYSRKLSEQIDCSKPFGVIGVSFGGLVAVEISKILNPSFTILISSVETRLELRWIYRGIGRLGLLKILPSWFFKIPVWVAVILFGTKRKKLLQEILSGTDPNFVKWAMVELCSWRNETKLTNRLKVGGSLDLLIPARLNSCDLIINGGHFMIVDQALDISYVVNEFLDKKNSHPN